MVENHHLFTLLNVLTAVNLMWLEDDVIAVKQDITVTQDVCHVVVIHEAQQKQFVTRGLLNVYAR